MGHYHNEMCKSTQESFDATQSKENYNDII